MVDPVLNFCSDAEYHNFMEGVTGFERDMARQGTILVKLYFSVTKQKQAERFQRDKSDPLRRWKQSELDVQAQERWDDFTNVKYEMLKKTHNSCAPWTVIRSNNKYKARLNVIKTILNSVPYTRLDEDLDFVPDSDIVCSGAHEIEMMDIQKSSKGKFLS